MTLGCLPCDLASTTRCTVGHALACLLGLGLMGCRIPNHSPPLPEPVLHETAPASPVPPAKQPSEVHSLPKVNSPYNAVIVDELPTPAEAPGSTISLAEAIRETLEADPRIRAGSETIKQAEAELWTASLLPNPELLTDISYLPLTRPFTIEKPGGPPELDIYLFFPIDWLVFGKRSAHVQSARAGVDVATAEYADLIRQRVAGTVTAYYDLAEALAKLALAREELESLKRLQAITRERVQAGRAEATEGDRIRSAVAEGQRDVRHREAAVVTERAALRAPLGRKDCDPEPNVEVAREVHDPVPPPPVEEVWQLADQHRPDILALRLRIAKAEADLRYEHKKGYPELKPRVIFIRQFQEKVEGVPDASSYALGTEVGLPIFDRNQGNVSKAESVLTQSIFTREAQLAHFRANIEEVVADYRVAYADVLANTLEEVQADRAERDKAEAAYRAGKKPLAEVLEAQHTYRDSAKRAVTEQASYWKALHRLNAAVGKPVFQ